MDEQTEAFIGVLSNVEHSAIITVHVHVVLVSRNMIGSGEDNKFQYTALQSDCTLIPRTLRAAVAGAGSLRA